MERTEYNKRDSLDGSQGSKKPLVYVIPATKQVVKSGESSEQRPIRVAAYCRVSTGDESQQTSYTTQKSFYTQMISSRPGWTFAGIYADEAISGTSRAKRKQFNAMMEDAVGGRLDYIVTKSISRFARNTLSMYEKNVVGKVQLIDRTCQNACFYLIIFGF